ncbi:hypothetical protein CEXT_418571 [Caerostris extrusa]|uniref:Ycf15 n=1 Tax=Caerostris extrusa TaxID=172846 RepID=A0AAV4VLJ8_CAEEX|nr:hypothetical protein CEXT_418571 [Caerostris extrusa]
MRSTRFSWLNLKDSCREEVECSPKFFYIIIIAHAIIGKNSRLFARQLTSQRASQAWSMGLGSRERAGHSIWSIAIGAQGEWCEGRPYYLPKSPIEAKMTYVCF